MQPPVVASMQYSRRFSSAHISDAAHRQDIDGLRALAALSVVATHTIRHAVPGGGAGVDMFFVLSGFLISGIILRALTRGKFSFSDFYARRIRRIFPSLVVILFVVWFVGSVVLIPDEYRRLGKDIATSAVFSLYIFRGLETRLPFDLDFGGNVLSQLWSLGVEEQFYLLWPLLLFCVYKLGKSSLSNVAIAMTAISIISFALLVAVNRLPIGMALVPWRGLYELSLGGLLALFKLDEFQPARWLAIRIKKVPLVGACASDPNILSFVAAVLLIYAILNDRSVQLFTNSWTLAPTFGALLLILSGSQSTIGRRIFGSSLMVFFGVISYPLYLWHFPVLVFLDALTWGHTPHQFETFALVLSISTALAFVTYKYVEVPIRFSARRAGTVASLCGAMSICGLLGLGAFTSVLRPVSYHFTGRDLALAGSEDWLSIPNVTSWTQFQDKPLILGRGEPHILFIGDSNMQQYYPRIQRLFSDDKPPARSVAFMTRFGCVPGMEIASGVDKSNSSGCGKYARDVLEHASKSSIDAIVVAGCWYGSFSKFEHVTDIGRGGSLRSETDASLTNLKTVMHGFIRSGKRVYLVLNIPVGLGLDPRARAYWHGKTPSSLSESEVLTALEPIDSKLRSVAKEVGATVVDPLNYLCRSGRCSVISDDGKSLYRDLWHLRPSYVRNDVTFMDGIVLAH